MTTTRIIIKKKGGHGGHHGGAWKVAYADFVTAMMALFIVLWLVNSNKAVQQAVGGYFRDPLGTAHLQGSLQAQPGPPASGSEAFAGMERLKQDLQRAVKRLEHFKDFSKQVEFSVTAEGLRIELIENAKGTFFALGSPEPSQNCRELLTALAQEISKVENRVTVEGHTDSRPYDGRKYSNWELSTDRANAARRIMTDAKLADSRFFQVRGYADRRLRYPDDPENAGNRRIAVLVQYNDRAAAPAAPLADTPVPEAKAPEAEPPAPVVKAHPEKKPQ